jgi:serine/threonine-protein kinase
MKRCVGCDANCPDEATRCSACGGEELALGRITIDGRYVVEAELGNGAMGVVFRARDVGLDRDVALKLIAPHFIADPSAVARFRREAAALAAVRNEHVVQVYSFGPHDGSFFFAMEYVRGPTLETLMREHADHDTFVPLHRALTILLQIASGLDAVHHAGIVHRDVKPSNIVIEAETGRPVLVDFGLAHRGSLEASEVVGTPSYMAPEQTGLAPSTTIGPPADVYGLACTAFDLLANRPPFLGNIPAILAQQIHVDPPRLSSFRAELAPLDRVFARALAKQPELRYPSCGALHEALEIASAPVLAMRPSSTDHASAPVDAEGREHDSAVFDPGAPRVLIVDDDDAFRRFATRAVQLAFYGAPVNVRSAPSGADALASARRHVPDVMVLDFDMPGLDGLSTLSALRALPGGTGTRVIVATAKAGDDTRWKFGVLGVGTFIDKPVTLPALVDAISSAAREREQVRHVRTAVHSAESIRSSG